MAVGGESGTGGRLVRLRVGDCTALLPAGDDSGALETSKRCYIYSAVSNQSDRSKSFTEPRMHLTAAESTAEPEHIIHSVSYQ